MFKKSASSFARFGALGRYMRATPKNANGGENWCPIDTRSLQTKRRSVLSSSCACYALVLPTVCSSS